LVQYTVDSLESADPRIIRAQVQNLAREAIFLRLQERISIGETYIAKYEDRLEKQGLIRLSKEYMHLLRSLYSLSYSVLCPNENDINSYGSMLYARLRELII